MYEVFVQFLKTNVTKGKLFKIKQFLLIALEN